MPKKIYPSEPPVFFNALLEEVNAARAENEPKFTVKTLDSTYTPWAQVLSDEHYPPQNQLPLD